MRTFLVVWLGQLTSVLGSKLSEFALAIWLYRRTDSITQFAIAFLLMYLPNIICSSVAGALVDRWNRRWTMISSDLIAGLVTLSLLVLDGLGQLSLWHVYLGISIFSVVTAFHTPAYTAAIAQLIPQSAFSRANGMVQISRGVAKLISPAIGGFLFETIQLRGVLWIDCSSFAIAVLTLLCVRFPALKVEQAGSLKLSQLLRETLTGWRYVIRRPGLQQLFTLLAITFFTVGLLEILFWSSVLETSSSTTFGFILSVGGCGTLFGSLFMSTWGGPKRRIQGILNFMPLQGTLMILWGLQTQLPAPWVAVGLFIYLFAYPIMVSCNQTILQSKVPMELQGRVFAIEQIVERIMAIVAYVATGPLVEQILEPQLLADGWLAQTIGRLVGLGSGRGISLILILVGLVNILTSIWAYKHASLRNIDTELPDAIPPDLSLGKA
jgi:MFS family permease